MPSIIQQSFGVNLRGMRLLGLYPPSKYKRLYSIQTWIMYFLCIVPVPVLQFLNLYVQENLRFMEVADNAFLIVELGCFIPKYWPFVINGAGIKKCINYFDSPYFTVEKKAHQEIMDDCIKVCRMATALFTISVTIGFISWSTRPIFWENHMFPTDIWLPFNSKTAPRSYICCVYVYLIFAVGYCACTSAATDPLMAALAYQATSQIRILKNNLQYLSEYVDEELESCSDINPSIKFRLIHDKIRNCAMYYQYILDFVQEYEKCFSQVAFCQFVGAVMVFCVTCLQLTIVEILSFNFVAMMAYLVAMLSEVYIYCHFGTILYEESNSILDAIYLSKWYEFDMKSKRSLLVLMERAKRPMTITCGKILDMSLVTFTMICRRAYSLLAVLENYNIELN